MNNEEKILAVLEKMDKRLNGIDKRLGIIEEDVEQIKEDTMITRSAANSLVKWADEVSVITQIKFPVQKTNHG